MDGHGQNQLMFQVLVLEEEYRIPVSMLIRADGQQSANEHFYKDAFDSQYFIKVALIC